MSHRFAVSCFETLLTFEPLFTSPPSLKEIDATYGEPSHTKAWFPAYKVNGKIVVNQTTRAMRSTSGTRLYMDVSWKAILPVPSIKLNARNKIPQRLLGVIRDAVKMPVKGVIGGSKYNR